MDRFERITSDWHAIDPGLELTGLGIVGRLLRLSAGIEKTLNENLRSAGLNINDFDILAVLRRSGKPYKLNVSDVLKELMLTSGGLSNRLDKLVALGFVERLHGQHDKRQVFITLTNAGAKTVDRMAPRHFTLMNTVVSSLSKSQKSELVSMLKGLTASDLDCA